MKTFALTDKERLLIATYNSLTPAARVKVEGEIFSAWVFPEGQVPDGYNQQRKDAWARFEVGELSGHVLDLTFDRSRASQSAPLDLDSITQFPSEGEPS